MLSNSTQQATSCATTQPRDQAHRARLAPECQRRWPDMRRTLLLHIEMLPEAQGGRQSPIAGGYMPHLVVEGGHEYLGVRLTGAGEVAVSGSAVVQVDLLYDGVDYLPLQPGVRFSVREGPRVVGSGVVLATAPGSCQVAVQLDAGAGERPEARAAQRHDVRQTER